MIIKSEIFSQHPEILHGISTKGDGAAPFYNNMSRFVGDEPELVMKNRAEFYTALGISDLSLENFAHANQIHSGDVTLVSKGGQNPYPKTDALLTNKQGVYLVISVADCLPVMLYDPVNKAIGNIHSGWRGTAQHIVTKTINKMKSEFGTEPQNLIAFIGPGITYENFEVGAEVAEMFDEKYNKPLPNSAEKFLIDLKAVVKDELFASGIKETNIDVCTYCTFTEAGMLHSYRRDKEKSGRMFSVIGLK
jgi:YfiH family protein